MHRPLSGVNETMEAFVVGLVTLATVAAEGSVTVNVTRLAGSFPATTTVTLWPVLIGVNVSVIGTDAERAIEQRFLPDLSAPPRRRGCERMDDVEGGSGAGFGGRQGVCARCFRRKVDARNIRGRAGHVCHGGPGWVSDRYGEPA